MSTLIVSSLLAKKAEVEAQIESLNGRPVEARLNLGYVVGAVRLFDPTAIVGSATAYHSVTKTLKRSDLFTLCRTALDGSPDPLCTRQLASHVITSQGWDADDRRLRLSMALKVGGMMARFEPRGIVEKVGIRDGATLWRLPIGGAPARPIKPQR